MSEIVLKSSNFFHNIDFLSKKLGGTEKIAIVLKDNAYGHGLLETATLAKKANITKAVVRHIDEALLVKDAFKDILILGELPKDSMPQNFRFAINSTQDIEKLTGRAKIDLKVDSGMHRNGILPNELDGALQKIVDKNLVLTGVFTHLRSADELSSEFFWQTKNFEDIKKKVFQFCKNKNIKIPELHSLNSAGALRQKKFDESFARIGISAYGYHEMPACFGGFDLLPVMALYGDKISTRVLDAGARVGYGGGYTLTKSTNLSTYDIGYGDGLLRLNEKHTYTNPDGKRLLGRVSMDYVSFEGESERVCIFSDVRPITSTFGTITYDQLVKLSPKIRRTII